MQKKYRVINGDLKDDTGYHRNGDLILMEEEQAALLVASNHLEPTVQDITPQAEPETQPDGLPARETMTTQPPNASSDGQDQQTPDKLAPQQNTVTPPAAPMPPQNAPANPSPEQIAKDTEQVG